MLALHNMRMELSNVRKKEKKRELTNVTKKTVKCNVETE